MRPIVSLAALVTTGALALSVLASPPATAKPTLLPAITAFGGTTTSVATAAMAGDGTTVVGRIAPSSDGAVQVQVRRPGGALGPVATLQAAQSGVTPYGLVLVGGPDGTFAATWNDGSGFALRMLPAGSSTWTPARDVEVLAGAPTTVVDARGRVWVAGTQIVSPFGFGVAVYGRTGAAKFTTITSTAAGFPLASGLTIGRDGRARVAASLTQSSGFFEAQPCSVRTTLLVADVAAGAASVPWSVLEARETNGMVTAAICNETSGTRLSQPRVVTTRNGTNVMTYVVAVAGTTQTSLREFVQRPGQPWQDLSTQALPFEEARFYGQLVLAGHRAVQVVSTAGSPITHAVAVRSPAGSWSGVKPLTGSDGAPQVLAAGSAGGHAVLAWTESVPPHRQFTRVLLPDGSLPAALPASGNAASIALAVAADNEGNAVTLQRFDDGGDLQARLLPLDVAGPRLTKALPKKAKVGAKLTLKATSVDVWSTLKKATWRVDGGKPKAGTSITVTFTTPGRHKIVLTLLDKAGNATTVSHVVTVTR